MNMESCICNVIVYRTKYMYDCGCVSLQCISMSYIDQCIRYVVFCCLPKEDSSVKRYTTSILAADKEKNNYIIE